MSIRWLSWYPGNDTSGYYFWSIHFIPSIEFTYNGDPESGSLECDLNLQFLFWQCIITYRKRRKINYD